MKQSVTNFLTFLFLICFMNLFVAYGQEKDTIVRHNVLDEVVVTGNRTLVNRNNVPMNITVVGRSEIENSSESALLPVLSERVPGLFVSERGITGFGVASGAAGGPIPKCWF